MDITTLCTVVAALRVIPNKSQFFQYDDVTLICEQPGASSEWTIKRNTSLNINQECSHFNTTNKSYRHFDAVYPSDSGVYWCESAVGECSDTVNITVTDRVVILDSPALPVMEGDNVTLSCRNLMSSTSNLTADFYKGGDLIHRSSTRNMTIDNISKLDEGLYSCNISGAGVSPESQLFVRRQVTAGRPDPPDFPLTNIILPVVVVSLLLICVMLLCLWRSYKDKRDSDVSYTDVIITQEVQPKVITETDAAATFYSTVKPGST